MSKSVGNTDLQGNPCTRLPSCRGKEIPYGRTYRYAQTPPWGRDSLGSFLGDVPVLYARVDHKGVQGWMYPGHLGIVGGVSVFPLLHREGKGVTGRSKPHCIHYPPFNHFWRQYKGVNPCKVQSVQLNLRDDCGGFPTIMQANAVRGEDCKRNPHPQ